jgi:L,D-transpeptidase catalytic domain
MPDSAASSGAAAATVVPRTATPRAAAPAYDTHASPCRPTASACVDIGAKKAWLQHDGKVVRGPVPIETGQPGHETPTGTFHVSWKAVYTTSTIYGLPMPHAVFFAAGGIAFHQGPLDSPSHGCVHLGAADAAAFYNALNRGDEVDVW